MRKISFVLLLMFLITGFGFSANPIYDDALIDEDLAVSTNYDLNLKLGKTIDYLSFQAVCSSNTYVGITGSTSTIDVDDDTIISSVTYPSGFSLLFTSKTWIGSTNFANNTTYYAIPSATGYIKLATTKANAVTETAVDITATGTSGILVFSAINIKSNSSFGFKWQCSNDGSRWYDLDVSTIEITSATATPTNYFWDLGFTVYKYIRCALTAGSFGSISLKLQGYGKRVAQ